MNGKVRIGVLVAVLAAAVVLGALFIEKSEAAAPKNMPLMASFRSIVTDSPVLDRIMGDDKGPYMDGVAAAGSASVGLASPTARGGGNFYMYLDNAGDTGLGRSVGFLFDQWAYSCLVDNRQDATSTEHLDFAIGPGNVVKTRWVEFRSYFVFRKDPVDGKYKENLEVLNFATMGLNGQPAFAYVGMQLWFGVTKSNGQASDEYYVGFRGDPVEVEALNIGPNGPREWKIRTIQDPAVYYNIYNKNYGAARMLLQLYYPPKPKRGSPGYTSICYGIYNMPFEIDLTRMPQ